MSMSPTLAILLDLWTSLSLRGGSAWLEIKGRVVELLRTYARVDDEDERAWIELDIYDLFKSAGLETLLADAYDVALQAQQRSVNPESARSELMDTEAQTEIDRLLAVEATPGINAWIADLAVDAPLLVGRRYELLFAVGTANEEVRARVVFPDELFGDNEQVEILILLQSEDVIIHGDNQQILFVTRKTARSAPLSFSIEPRRAGQGTVQALFLARNRLFQQLTLSLAIETATPGQAGHTLHASGRTLASALLMPDEPHLLTLTILKREPGYELILMSSGIARAFLRISTTQLADLIEHAREELKTIVSTSDGGRRIYQLEDTEIPEHIHAATLRRLAQLGSFLYEQLFYAPGNGPDAHEMGTLLRELAATRRLRIQIVAERFIFPWALLYDQQPLDLDAVDAERFWGYRHSIEYLPEFSSRRPVHFLPDITIGETLAIDYVYHEGIDTQIGGRRVASQRDFLRDLPGVALSEHPNVNDLCALLKKNAAGGQLVYFYCHATGNLPHEAGGVMASQISLTDGNIRLRELYIQAPVSGATLQSAPLIFMNACRSARLSPYLYDGLAPYFIAKGARGIIGTEADTPAHFAAEFAQKLIERFSSGQEPLGTTFSALRRWYWDTHNNVLGLLYALYCDASIRVRRGAPPLP